MTTKFEREKTPAATQRLAKGLKRCKEEKPKNKRAKWAAMRRKKDHKR